MPPDYQAITLRANKGVRLAALITPCHIYSSVDHQGAAALPRDFQFQAIWDTGATNSVINQRVVDLCGLAPIGMTRVHVVDGINDAEVYMVNMKVLNQINFGDVRVTKGEIKNADVLIGMDIITQGDFSISNVGGTTVFSYRAPSQKEVDYVDHHNRETRQARLKSIGRKKKGKRPPKKHGKNKRHRH